MERDPRGDTKLAITYWLFGPMLGVGNLKDGHADAQNSLILFLSCGAHAILTQIIATNWHSPSFSVKCLWGSFFPSHPYPIIPLGMCLLQLDSTRYAFSPALSRLFHCRGGNRFHSSLCLQFHSAALRICSIPALAVLTLQEHNAAIQPNSAQSRQEFTFGNNNTTSD